MTKYSEGERAVLSQAADMLDLTRTPGWKTLEKLISSQIEERTAVLIRGDISSVADFTEQERLKGSLIALKSILALPQGIITHAEMIRADHSSASGNGEDE